MSAQLLGPLVDEPSTPWRPPLGRRRARTRVVIDRIGLPQALRWHAGALWFSDQFDDVVYRWTGGSTLEPVARISAPGGLGFLPDGRLLVVSTADGRIYRRDEVGSLVVHADLDGRLNGPLNDMITDAQGRAWVGNYGFDFDAATRDAPHSELYAPPGPARTALLRVDPDGSVHDTTWPVMFPNGCCWSAQSGALLVCETLAFTITALPVAGDGALGAPEEWARLIDPWLWNAVTSDGLLGTATRRLTSLLDHPRVSRLSSSPIAPEALAAETDGTVWVANALRGELLRLARGGRLVERVRTSGHTLGVSLGGPRGRTLFAGTVPTLDAEKSATTFAGRIELVELEP